MVFKDKGTCRLDQGRIAHFYSTSTGTDMLYKLSGKDLCMHIVGAFYPNLDSNFVTQF
jgi:hypothetical protein